MNDSRKEVSMVELKTVCKRSELPEGESTIITVNHQDVAIFHVGGEYFAINDRCPHAGASLSSGYVEDGIVTCPWHGWRFRLKDGEWADNPRVKTECYRLQITDDLIQIECPSSPCKDDQSPGSGCAT